MSTTPKPAVMVKSKAAVVVDLLIFLGSILNREGGTEAGVKVRIRKAQAAIRELSNVWRAIVIDIGKVQILSTQMSSQCFCIDVR